MDHNNLIRHTVVRHAALPYACKEGDCNAAYRTEFELRLHLRASHKLSHASVRRLSKGAVAKSFAGILRHALVDGASSAPDTLGVLCLYVIFFTMCTNTYFGLQASGQQQPQTASFPAKALTAA